MNSLIADISLAPTREPKLAYTKIIGFLVAFILLTGLAAGVFLIIGAIRDGGDEFVILAASEVASTAGSAISSEMLGIFYEISMNVARLRN